MAHDRLRDNLLEVSRGGSIPLFDGAAECLVRNASHEQSLEHHRGLFCTLDSAVLEVNTCEGFRVQGLGSGALGRGPNRLGRYYYI